MQRSANLQSPHFLKSEISAEREIFIFSFGSEQTHCYHNLTDDRCDTVSHRKHMLLAICEINKCDVSSFLLEVFPCFTRERERVNFKILDEHPHHFLYRILRGGGGGGGGGGK